VDSLEAERLLKLRVGDAHCVHPVLGHHAGG
jgi:hypothetical protein